MLKSQLSSYEIGDWFHYSESEVIGECTGGGDGVTLPTCLITK